MADMMCPNCGEVFELKSKKGRIGKKVADGAYSTMIDRISCTKNPELLLLQYSSEYSVTDLTLIPKFFFVPRIIEKRPPLSSSAKRAGWVGCNILFSEIPDQGKITIIKNGAFCEKERVIAQYSRAQRLRMENLDARGWLFDVLSCINQIPTRVFSLKEAYAFSEYLRALHPENHNVEAKIRQQLQLLRDRGLLAFLGNGVYEKIV